MPRTCIRFFALLLLLLVAVPALQAAPLLQEGKKTLYQRVVSHPGAMPLKEARDGAPAAREALVPFTVLYVYARQGDWLQVGLDTRAAGLAEKGSGHGLEPVPDPAVHPAYRP